MAEPQNLIIKFDFIMKNESIYFLAVNTVISQKQHNKSLKCLITMTYENDIISFATIFHNTAITYITNTCIQKLLTETTENNPPSNIYITS